MSDDITARNNKSNFSVCACGKPYIVLNKSYEDDGVLLFSPMTIKICSNPNCFLSVNPERLGRWKSVPIDYKFVDVKAVENSQKRAVSNY